jgi:hypothetical protein
MTAWGKNLLLNPSFEIQNEFGQPQNWAILEFVDESKLGSMTLSATEKHHGDFSVQFTNNAESDVMGIYQDITLDQTEIVDVFISGWSKSNTNSSLTSISPDYSIYVDIWNQDGSNTWGEIAEFTQEDSGNWLYSSHVIRSSSPIRMLKFMCIFRNQKGTVYFDDLGVRLRSPGCKNHCGGRGSCFYQVCRCYEPYFGLSCGNKKTSQ